MMNKKPTFYISKGEKPYVASAQGILEIGAHRVAGFVAEPIGGASTGAEVPHDLYFPRIQAICEKYNIKLVLDEVLCGVGRSGKWLAASHWNTVADVVCLAKGLGQDMHP